MATTKLTLTILKEDILLDNYHSYQNCPITKALARAGRSDLHECAGIYQNEGNVKLLNYTDYKELYVKMFGMYKTFSRNITGFDYEGVEVDALEPADFDYVIEFEEAKPMHYYEIHVTGKNGFSTAIVSETELDDDDVIMKAYEQDKLEDDDCHHVDYVNKLSYTEWNEQFNFGAL